MLNVQWSPKRNARTLTFASQHRLQDNWTPFKAIPVSSTSLQSAKANSQNRTTLALSGKVKTAFVTLRFTFFLRYLLQLLFSVLLAAFFAFSFYYDKKGARNEEDHLHVWWFQRPMAWHHSGASWCNEPGQCAASCFRSPLYFPPEIISKFKKETKQISLHAVR